MSRTTAAITLSAICALSLLVATSTRGAFQNPGNATDREKIAALQTQRRDVLRELVDRCKITISKPNVFATLMQARADLLHAELELTSVREQRILSRGAYISDLKEYEEILDVLSKVPQNPVIHDWHASLLVCKAARLQAEAEQLRQAMPGK